MVDNQWEENRNTTSLCDVNTEDLLLVGGLNSQETFHCIDSILRGTDSQEIATLSQIMDQNDGQHLPLNADLAAIAYNDVKPEPEHWDQFPTLNDVSGDSGFEVFVPTSKNNSTSTYSAELNKIFIKPSSLLKLDVLYNTKLYGKMFLRTMMVYPDCQYEPVVRCNNHKVQNGKVETPGQECHVIKCPHDNVTYVGAENGKKFRDRLALIFPLTPQQKCENNDKVLASVDMLFVCQNSCPSGMNRRATVLFLTLEDERGNMYGQKTINLKICTVPRRDKDKEESLPEKKKRKSSTPSTPSSSKKVCRTVPESAAAAFNGQVKSEHHDVEETLPTNQVQCERVSSAESLTSGIACKIIMPDCESMCNVLHFARNELAGKMVDDPDNAPRYGKFMKNIKKLQQSLPPGNEHNN
ncbi:cellular tumor antigen p53 isoform X1 [Lutzomyia longipalpis]|uniref:cellular tumor antigen p53 isoform X1 n=1 Tax=Lutzomyia longipalpis TaxID=7200 RepID=UPI002483F9D1|nr:cellular tumor antigen p53 isoform X1 [Lutzomyia longipalpis]XP_055677824.1 cellular tumor antigen p53 isoform X1 [Lutzomyia longipalpis]